MEVLAVIAVIAGTLSQRITGMGSALIISPFLVLLFGPLHGVVITVIAGGFIALLVFLSTWRDVDWRTLVPLAAFAIPGMAVGAWIASLLPSAESQIAIGVMVILALGVSLLLERNKIVLERSAAAGGTAGFISGAMNAIAGIGGPPVSAYAIMVKMPHRAFVALLQPFFLVVSSGTLLAKLLIEDDIWPQVPAWFWPVMLIAVGVGHMGGTWLSRRVPVPVARAVMIVLAFGGGVSALFAGIVALLT